MVSKLLGILLETSSSNGSLALCVVSDEKNIEKKCQLIEHHYWSGPAHSSYITQKFEKILQTKESEKISFVALGVGPGRFTGVRVGVSFAKTLAFSYNIPVYSVSSLKILAESQIHQSKPVLVLVNAFKNSMYAAIYQKQNGQIKELLSPCVIQPGNLHHYVQQECLCVGDGYEVYKAFFSKELNYKLSICSNNLFPDVKDLAHIVGRDFQISECLNWKQVQPVYLRSPVEVLKSNV